MSLLDEMMDECVLMDKKRLPDGEGGFITSWHEGAEFRCAVTLDTSMQARIAQADNVTNIYTVTTQAETMLEFHDVFKRLRDGKIFRVTSDGSDNKTPNSSALNIVQMTAERWELPK